MAVKAKAQITLSYIIDVKAYYRYYLLQGSTLAKPSTPTTFPPPSTWTDAEPSYTSGSTNSLYFVDCTVFCDDTFKYSAVSLSTSYEVAKEAYNKANNAQNSVDNMEIGGRNLYIGSGSFSGDNWKNIAAWMEDGVDSLGNTVMTKTTTWTGLFQAIQAKAGESYTLSANVRGDGTAKLWFYITEVLADGTETTHAVKQGIVCPTTETRFGETWTVTADCTIRFRIENSVADHSLWVSSLKLERGNKATDWSPAPEDMASIGRVDELDNTINNVDTRLDEVVDTSQANKESLDSAWEIVEENKKQITDLLQENGEITMNFTTLSTTVSELNGAYKTDYDERIKYIKFIDGEIWLGKEKESDTENDFKVVISNTKISFLQNGSEVAYISNNKLYISEAHITKSLRIGHFVTIERANGNVGTYWVDD